MGPYAFMWILMGSFGVFLDPLFVLMDSNWYLKVCMGLY